jgi:hypothetical protein
MMDCGVGSTPVADSLSEWFSFIGLGGDQPQKEDMDRTDRTPETVYFDDDDDHDINETTTSSIISKQLSFIQCIPISATLTKPKFHRQCNPTTCRMTSGMCVDCAQCLNHCVCGDNAKLLPATCDTPECNPIICSDCMRCNTHCTCYCDPNLLRNEDDNNSLISFDPPSITNKLPHQSSIKIKKVVEKKDNNNNNLKTKADTKNKKNQHLDLSRRTHSLLSNDDDEDEENGKNGPINSRRFTDTNETHTKNKSYTGTDTDNNNNNNNNNRMANTRIVSIGGRNIVSDEEQEEVEEEETSNVFGGCDDIDEVYAEIEIPAEGTMSSSITTTSPITTFDISTSTTTTNSISPTRASASTAPRNNLGGRKRSWLPHLNRRRSITSSRNK